jgi:hypothetical protein
MQLIFRISNKGMIRSLFILYILLSVSSDASAQYFKAKNYPANYFRWPVGATIGIAANFGELRPNHYHMGLDARTERRENMPILAAAAGYVAKVKIEPFGFGRCIYVNHPNGLTTLYAHLNAFNPALEQYIKEQQYKLKKWNIFIDIPESLFPVNKGDLLAYSGNTGGSQGPHLHFEIRDTRTDKVLNPLLFQMPITDKTPPDVLRLAMYDRCVSTYEQSPKMIPLKKVNGVYQPVSGNIIVNTDKVSFAITAYDRYTGSTNQNGIYSAVMLENGLPVSGFEMDSISYDETRYLNAHIDYRTKSRGGPYLQHLSNLPGHSNGIYKTNADKGVVSLSSEPKEIKIEVSDANGNISTIAFKIKAADTLKQPSATGAHRMFHPGFINVFENENVRFYLPEKSLYDSFRFKYQELDGATGKIFKLHEPIVPVHTYFPVSLRGNFSLADTAKVIMKRSFGSKEDYAKAIFNEGWYTASFREFGNYQLLVDKVPPVISTVSRSATRISFSITDDTEIIRNFSATLDGEWLRFSNDKGRTYIYTFDEHCPPGDHELKITAEDLAGNVSTKIFRFKR